MSMPASAGSASGDSTAVISGDVTDVSRDSASIEATPSDEATTTTDKASVTPAAEKELASPSARNHSQVSNCNLALRNVYRLLVDGAEEVWSMYLKEESAKAKIAEKTTYDAAGDNATRAGIIKSYLKNTTCLPEAMVDAFTTSDANVVLETYDSADATSAHRPIVANVEDESDLQFIFKMLTERMEKIRECQITNDREQQRIQYVRETSECNQAFHQVEFDRLTGFNDAEVDARYAAGAQMAADLDALKGQHSVTKQTFFNDITLKGCCW